MTSKSIHSLLKERKICQVVNHRLIQAPPETTIMKAIALMHEEKSPYIVVAKEKKVVGIFTDADYVEKVLGGMVNWDAPLSDYMTPDPIVLTPDHSVGEAVDLMGEHMIYNIPLVNENKELVNIISVRTIIRFLAECYPSELLNLPPDPNQVMPSAEGG